MQYKFIVIDDTGNDYMHGAQFETVAQAQSYVFKHKLAQTHLIYDLSTATVVQQGVNNEYSKNSVGTSSKRT